MPGVISTISLIFGWICLGIYIFSGEIIFDLIAIAFFIFSLIIQFTEYFMYKKRIKQLTEFQEKLKSMVVNKK